MATIIIQGAHRAVAEIESLTPETAAAAGMDYDPDEGHLQFYCRGCGEFGTDRGHPLDTIAAAEDHVDRHCPYRYAD
jgi:predicted RNA-binding Zn-ribbon protein involved in translation (DUF1610 family)